MRASPYDTNARRRTVSISLNADLAAKASAAGINISRTAEAALSAAFIAHETDRIRAELRAAAEFTDRIVAEHGLPFGEFLADGEEPAA